MPRTDGKKPPRPFKSAEKPISLHPLSFKQAVTALLLVGPLEDDTPRGDQASDG